MYEMHTYSNPGQLTGIEIIIDIQANSLIDCFIAQVCLDSPNNKFHYLIDNVETLGIKAITALSSTETIVNYIRAFDLWTILLTTDTATPNDFELNFIEDNDEATTPTVTLETIILTSTITAAGLSVVHIDANNLIEYIESVALRVSFSLGNFFFIAETTTTSTILSDVSGVLSWNNI